VRPDGREPDWAARAPHTLARMDLSRAHAEALDAADPLAHFRTRFVIEDPDLVYLDGNSLGRLPRATADRLQELIRAEWGGELIRAWDHWIHLPGEIGDRIAAGLLGAEPGEVVVADSTSVNFYRLVVAALDARPGRRTIVTDRANFPTDRYVLEGIAAAGGLTIRWLDPDPVAGPQPAEIATALDDDVALVTLCHVDYRSAAIADMAAITARAHDAGALVLWDLCHSVGAIPVELAAAGADLAVGCTYKYLNSGPGAPAFLYVRRALQDTLRNPIQGWFGQRDQFAMAQGYDPVDGIGRWLVGTPSVIGLTAVDVGVGLSIEAGIDAIRAKGIALTDYAIGLFDGLLAPRGATLGSPRVSGLRGAHVSIRHPDARRLCAELIARDVVPDFREPDGIRLGLSPLTSRYTDAWDGIDRLAGLIR
jgi:kynureninase